MLNYIFVIICVVQNIWADLLTPWTIPFTIRHPVSIPLLSTSASEHFEEPSTFAISASQATNARSRPTSAIDVDNLLRTATSDPMLIYEDDGALPLRLVVIVQSGAAGHCGSATTTETPARLYFWATLC